MGVGRGLGPGSGAVGWCYVNMVIIIVVVVSSNRVFSIVPRIVSMHYCT